MTSSDIIALTALGVSLAAFLQSLYFWRRSFRPIVTAMVRTSKSGNNATAFNLALLNSGSIPARNITLHVADQIQLENALDDPTSDQRKWFLSCFEKGQLIPIIHNGAEVTCSFGFVAVQAGFWKHAASFPVDIRYEGWFGTVYVERQELRIVDSSSFTGHTWGNPNAT